MEEHEEKILTYGEDAVGLTFNPGGNPKVDKVKKLYAKIIDILNDVRTEEKMSRDIEAGERIRLLSVAITEAQTAQMWAVKGLTK